MRRWRAAPVVTIAAVSVLATTACRDDRVLVVYAPPAGASYAYDVHVASSSTTTIPGRPTASPHDEVDLTAHQRVLDTSGGTTRVEVTLDRPGVGARTFVMRFDRAAQLSAVESVEGIPTGALGELGLSEIFPAAAGAPPDRRLRPGDRWVIDDLVQLPGMDAPARLSGTGRLVSLGVEGGRDTATVTSTTTLPLRATTSAANSVQTLEGTETTEITVVYDLADGSVRRSTAVTTGAFQVTLAPPGGQTTAAIRGTVDVEVRSRISRV